VVVAQALDPSCHSDPPLAMPQYAILGLPRSLGAAELVVVRCL
jgi:hypothetical protein